MNQSIPILLVSAFLLSQYGYSNTSSPQRARGPTCQIDQRFDVYDYVLDDYCGEAKFRIGVRQLTPPAQGTSNGNRAKTSTYEVQACFPEIKLNDGRKYAASKISFNLNQIDEAVPMRSNAPQAPARLKVSVGVKDKKEQGPARMVPSSDGSTLSFMPFGRGTVSDVTSKNSSTRLSASHCRIDLKNFGTQRSQLVSDKNTPLAVKVKQASSAGSQNSNDESRSAGASSARD